MARTRIFRVLLYLHIYIFCYCQDGGVVITDMRSILLLHGRAHRSERWRSCGIYTYGLATISRLLKMKGFFAEYSLFYGALLQKRPIILRNLLLAATP